MVLWYRKLRTKALVCAFRGLIVERDEAGVNGIRETDAIYGAAVGAEVQEQLAEVVTTARLQNGLQDVWIIE